MEFHGVNAFFIEEYIEFKRNHGYALKNTYNFRMFDRFTIENGAITIGLTKELAEKSAEKRPMKLIRQGIKESMISSIFLFT